MSSPVSLNDIHLSYGTLSVLRDFSLDLSEGKVTALLGPTGSGKTRVLRLIAGLEKASQGNIKNNVPAEKTGYVFQNSNLVPWLTGEENLNLCLRADGNREQLEKWITEFSLQDQLKKRPHQLSGGQKQKFNLLRGFSNASTLFLMDEPFTGLDPSQKQSLYDVFFKLRSRNPGSVLLVTHDIDEALLLSDRICLLSPRLGKIEKEIPNPFQVRTMVELRKHPQYLTLFAELDAFFKKFQDA